MRTPEEIYAAIFPTIQSHFDHSSVLSDLEDATWDVVNVLENVLEATKPRQIKGYAELAALPYSSAVLTSDISDTVVLRSDHDDFVNQSGHTVDARTLWDYGTKPITVLWEPLP